MVKKNLLELLVFNIFAGTQHRSAEEVEKKNATLHFLHFNISISNIHILYECKQKNNSTKTKGNRNVSEHLEIML